MSRKGVTLIEVLLSGVILSIVLAALFIVLKIGEQSRSIGSAKVDLQGRVRQAVGYFTKDVRQTTAYNIVNQSTWTTIADHFRFNQVDSWTSAGGGHLVFNSEYIDYSYDDAQDKIIRRVIDSGGNTTWTLEFGNIIASPFFTRDTGNNIVALNKSDLQTSGKIIIMPVGEAEGRTSFTFTLQEEVKIRNNE